MDKDHCPKCGNSNIAITSIRYGNSDNNYGVLIRVCEDCQYKWEEAQNSIWQEGYNIGCFYNYFMSFVIN